jgi:hypothetical protein
MARDIQLINCSGVTVHGDVERFIGLGVDGLTIDNTYSNSILIGHSVAPLKPVITPVTADFTIDGKTSIYEIDLDVTGIGITCTWDAVAYPIQVVFKIVSNTSAVDFFIDCGLVTIDGNVSPYTTGLITNDSLTVYSNGTVLYIIQ